MRARPKWILASSLVLLAVVGSVQLDHAAPVRGPIGRFAAGDPDTQVVWTGQGSGYAGVGTGSWATYATTCTIPNFNAARRYIIRIANGTSSGTRVSELAISVNGNAALVASDVTVNIASTIKVVMPASITTLTINVRGSTSSFVKLDMISTPDPSYLIWGPTTYTMPEVPEEQPPGGFYSETTDILTRPDSAAAPWMLRIDNGEPDGSARASARVYLNGTQLLSTGTINPTIDHHERQITLKTSGADDTLKIRLYGETGDHLAVSIAATDTTPPVLVVAWPPDEYVTDSSRVKLAGHVSDQGPVDLYSSSTTCCAAFLGAFSDSVNLPPADGRYGLTFDATNGAGYTSSTRVWVTRDSNAPTLTVAQPSVAVTTTSSPNYAVQGSWADVTQTRVTVNGDSVGYASSGSINRSIPLALGANTAIVRAVDAMGRVTTVVRTILYEPAGAGLGEPTPSALDPTQIDLFKERNAFLYTGPGAVQTGVVGDSIKSLQAAVIRGRVIQATSSVDTQPLAHVTVRVVGHPEYGSTVSRASGWYDLAVSGGGPMVLEYSRAGFIRAQRVVTVPWRDYVVAEDVALKGFDPAVTTVGSSQVLARGSLVEDEDGARRAMLFFRDSTVARMVRAPDDTITLTSMGVRATEFSVGANGERAMPGILPPSSAYTYCVELSVDGEPADSSRTVLFSRPVSFYVENFLGFPVGSVVPVGSYDLKAGKWAVEANGRVIRILSTSGGVATIDITGDSQADTGSVLTALGFDLAERQQLGSGHYAEGQTLWRCQLSHFSAADLNWPFAFGAGSIWPNGEGPNRTHPKVNDCRECPGSIIQAENQSLIERIPVVGTPFELAYSSERVLGDRRQYQVTVPLSGSSVPGSMSGMDLRIEAAGRVFNYRYTPEANKSVTWEWDGLDAYGRVVQGSVQAHIRVGFTYPNVYVVGESSGSSAGVFGAPRAGVPSSFEKRLRDGTLWSDYWVPVGAFMNGYAGLGGWSLSPHHAYDVSGSATLYRGDGTAVSGERMPATIRTRFGPSTFVSDMLVAPDGSVYIAAGNQYGRWVDRFMPDGRVVHVAGHTRTTSLDGQPAVDVILSPVGGLALGPDGSLYLTQQSDSSRIRYVTPDGIMHTLLRQKPADSLDTPGAVTVGPDGSVYVADKGNGKIFRIAPDKTIFRLTGGSAASPTGDGIGAVGANSQVQNGCLVLDEDGSLVYADELSSRVRRIGADGIVTTLATISSVKGLARAQDGSLYAASGSIAYRISPAGEVVAIAGATTNQSNAEGGAALRYDFDGGLHRIAVSPEGIVYLIRSTSNGSPIFVVEPALPGFNTAEFSVPSTDASELYVFSNSGRHLRTLNAFTGVTAYTFTYATNNGRQLLSKVTDFDGNETRIFRASSGTPDSIIAPFGQVTRLSVDSGITPPMLQRIENPTHTETDSMYYTANGLLVSLVNARGYRTGFAWDALGRLLRDAAPDSMSQQLDTLSVSGGSIGDRRIRLTSKLGRQTEFGVDHMDGGAEARTTTRPDGLVEEWSRTSTATTTFSSPDESSISSTLTPDPRFGMRAPITSALTLARPHGLPLQVTNSRTAALFGDVTDTRVVNGRGYVDHFTTGPPRFELTPPSGSSRKVIIGVDAMGRDSLITLPGLASVAADYTSTGLLESYTVGSRQWTYTHDSRGRVETVTDPLSRVTRFEYDGADRVTLQELPNDSVIVFRYDAVGNLSSLKPPGRPAHTFAATSGNLTRHYDPPAVSGLSVDTTGYVYNSDRQLVAIVRPDTQTVSLDYGASTGRLESVRQASDTTSLGYDSGTGQLSTLGRSGVNGDTLTFAYDGPLLTRESWSRVGAPYVDLQYDANGWPTTQRVHGANGNSDITYHYDADGLIEDVAVPAGTFDLRRSTTHGLSIGTGIGTMLDTLGYNLYGELASVGASANSTRLYGAAYARDSLGRITRISETVLGVTTDRGFTYDVLGRLVAVRDSSGHTDLERYDYDANGNRTSSTVGGTTKSATYDDQDRLLTYGSASYTYTGNGERRTRSDGSASATYTHDAFGNLKRVDLPGGSNVEYLIDGRNRRVGRRVNGTLVARWIYQNGLSPVAELDASGNITKRFVYASRGHAPDLMVVGDSTYRLITDHLGSVRQVVNAATGAVRQQLAYDAWGNVTLDTNPGFQPLGYAGGLTDATTGLVRFGARDYEPATGRWTAKDPIGFGGGFANVYVYVNNAPIQNGDPSGMLPKGRIGPPVPPFIVVSILEDLYRIHEAVADEGSRQPAEIANAWRHAEAGHRIACRYGERVAWYAGIFQELLRPSKDAEVDLMNNWQGMSYGMSATELAKRGLLIKTPGERHAKQE